MMRLKNSDRLRVISKMLFVLLAIIGFAGFSFAQNTPITFEFGEASQWETFTSDANEEAVTLKWIDVNTSEDTWSVQDSILVCTGLPIGVARSEKQYENFMLHVEWMHLEPGGNSGVFVWSSAVPGEENRLPDGVEVQMLELDWVNLNLRDGVKPPVAYVQGELFGVGGVETKPDNPRGTRSKSIEHRAKGKGEWNTYDVVCVDGVIKLSVNGKFVNGISQSSQKKGYICLESEGAEIHFRNFRIVELPSGVTSHAQTAPKLGSINSPSQTLKENQGFIFQEYKLLAKSKAAVNDKDQRIIPAFYALIKAADEALNKGPYTVMNKRYMPPSGDKHDYVSMGKYWWPDPDSPDGLPYIRKDGEVNPEKADFDRDRLGSMMNNVQTLALAYYFTDNQAYAEKAIELMETWFLDPNTKMNPHLRFGQHVPGREEGRNFGIIDTKGFAHLPDAMNFIRDSDQFSAEFELKMKSWFEQYLDWLWTSELGQKERAYYNNHSTSYDVQTTALALYLNDSARYCQILNNVPKKRIDTQVEPDGRQPYELARTRAFSYSVNNAAYLFELGILGERTNIPIFGYVGPEGQSLKKALEFMVPYATAREEWPYEQISPMLEVYQKMDLLFRQAAYYYNQYEYLEMAEQIPEELSSGHRINLLYPTL